MTIANSALMRELKNSREQRVRTEPIELEEVSIVEELDQQAAPKKPAVRAVGTTPPPDKTDDWLDRLDL